MNPKPADLLLAEIRLDGGTQLRAGPPDLDYLAELGEHLAELPRVIVFDDGADKWLADGHQRVEAHRRKGRKAIRADVFTGTLRDAKAYALSANARHGRPRTPEDLDKVFRTILADPEWGALPNTRIATLAGTSEATARRYLGRLSSSRTKMRTVERGGSSYAMDVSGLSGMSKRAWEALPEADRRKLVEQYETSDDADQPAAAGRQPAAAGRGPARVSVTLLLPEPLIAKMDAAARKAKRNREAWLRWLIEREIA